MNAQPRATALGLFLNQFKSPLVLILIFAAAVSAFVREWLDAAIVLAVVLGSAMLGFVQEYRAGNAVEKLRSQVTVKSSVLRDGQPRALPSEEVVPGDVVLLSAGSLIPADGVVLEANDFFVNQAVLTGETFPVEKKAGPGAGGGQPGRAHQLRLHGHQRAQRHGPGADRADRAADTVFGQIADRLSLRPPRPSSSAASAASATC